MRSRGLDRDVGAGAHREAEVGLGERGGVVDAVADHRHDPALAPAGAATTSTLSAGQHLGDHLVDADLGGDRARGRPRCRRSAAPGAGRAPRSSRDRLGARRLDACRRPRAAPRTAPSQAGDDGGPAGGLRPLASAAASAPSSVEAPVGEQRGPADDDGVAVDHALDAEALAVGEALERRAARPSLVARGPGDRPGDRVLGGVLERAGEAQHLGAVRRRRRRRRRPAPSRPVVTVPVLSSTIVSTRRVDSSTSGPLIRMPSCAPRPVPTSSAVGVARPSAHGQAMISTATAAVKANVGAGAGGRARSRASPPRARSRPARRPPRPGRRAAAPAPCRSAPRRRAAPIWASAVSAPTRVARTTSRPPALTVAPATASPGPTSTGHASRR